jgi:hypothetical protein
VVTVSEADTEAVTRIYYVAANSGNRLHDVDDRSECRQLRRDQTGKIVEKPLTVYPEWRREWCGHCSTHRMEGNDA